MEADFWHARWESNQIGFHLPDVNPYLRLYWPRLALPAGSRVLVPLSGKSLDLCWLAEQGHEVIGVEISPIAVKAFFAENHLQARRIVGTWLDVWEAGKIRVFCGDLFNLTATELGQVDAVYDRAALIALPAARRRDYAELLDELLPNPVPHLLVTLEYEQARMDGPPFAVSEAEIHSLFGARHSIECVGRDDVLAQNERFRERGLAYLNEAVYLLQPQ